MVTAPPWRNVDFVKGVLIAFVFLGHYISGSLDDNVARYLIYYFHMPVFMGISGFLVTQSKLCKSTREVLRSMRARLIIPWLIALIFYLAVFGAAALIQGRTIDIQFVFDMIVKPYYHLWYVPAYIVYFFVLKALRCKAGIGIGVLLGASGFVALASYGIYDACIMDKGIIGVLFYDVRPHFFFYFVLGYALRKRLHQEGCISTKPSILLCVVVICAAGYALLFETGASDFIRGIIALVGNGATIALLMDLSVREMLPASKVLERIGQNSLFIYLYHIPIVWLLRMMPGYGALPVYCVGFLVWFAITAVANKYSPKRRLPKLLAKWSGWSSER